MLRQKHYIQHLLSMSSILLLIGSASLMARGQQSASAYEDKLRLAEKVADNYIRQLRQTFDFREIAREIFHSQSASFYRGQAARGLNPEQRKEDAEKAERIYVADMNYYFLSLVYELSIKPPARGQTKMESVPPEVASAMKSSKFRGPDMPPLGIPIETPAQVEEFIAETEFLATLYRNRITGDAFDSGVSKPVRVKSHIVEGEPELGPHATIYNVVRGIFAFSFIEEKGKFKVYRLAITTGYLL